MGGARRTPQAPLRCGPGMNPGPPRVPERGWPECYDPRAMTGDAQSIKRLVESARVHRAVYTDPALFELELDRLFGRAWLVLGHASQVARPGDFFTTRMGRESVIVT